MGEKEGRERVRQGSEGVVTILSRCAVSSDRELGMPSLCVGVQILLADKLLAAHRTLQYIQHRSLDTAD